MLIAQEKAGHPAQGRSPLSLCFQDCPAAEKESKVLRIVSQGQSGPWGWGGTGLRLDILPSIRQSSHVAGICCNILSCCPEELLKQKAVLERIESVMPSNHFILCHTLLLLPSVFPSIRVFSNELALRIK